MVCFVETLQLEYGEKKWIVQFHVQIHFRHMTSNFSHSLTLFRTLSNGYSIRFFVFDVIAHGVKTKDDGERENNNY